MTEKRTFFYADAYQILDVLETDGKNFDREKVFGHKPLESFQIFEFVDQWSEEVKIDVKVGDLLPVKINHKLRPITRLKRTKNKRQVSDFKIQNQKREKDYPIQLEIFLKTYDLKSASEAKKLLADLTKDEEEFAYRVFYSSFKMYRMREYVLDMAATLIALTSGVKKDYIHLKDLVDDFKAVNFDHLLVKALEDMCLCYWNLDRNEGENWYEDSVQLWGAYSLFKTALQYLVGFMDKMDQKKTFLSEQRGFIDWTEAGAMEIWLPLNLLRGADKEQTKKYLSMIR